MENSFSETESVKGASDKERIKVGLDVTYPEGRVDFCKMIAEKSKILGAAVLGGASEHLRVASLTVEETLSEAFVFRARYREGAPPVRVNQATRRVARFTRSARFRNRGVMRFAHGARRAGRLRALGARESGGAECGAEGAAHAIEARMAQAKMEKKEWISENRRWDRSRWRDFGRGTWKRGGM